MDMGGGRLIRIMILVLVMVLVWKIWDYSALPVLEPPSFNAESEVAKGFSSSKLQKDQEQNSVLQAPVDEEHLEVAVKSTMRIEIYYEVLCPDSRHFIMKQLTPAYEKLKDILQVGLVPYGKAETQEKNGKITFDCQHGPRECEGNIVHACVTNIIKDEAKQIAIVHCMIDRNEQPMLVGKKCVEKHGENWGSISSCVSSDKGISILKHMGQMTHRLKPEVSFIPTITIDGSQEDQKHILQDFHKVLCKRYKGPRHPSC
ncbi:gamma-interferon-inducible lysosomal thiol reductase-like isoform X3 [Penaeus japonicus]|uniref:gamma-interferon-inducible lysosomal thiol reductase-like isoform X3 n=1 Tax=Penaeus japonicus TaxID=27405 RepID=UPI001C713155|nr:gamma-interferon-inducible lysosomal thiol reductase-like isoform X3 [Penaeus japonicus]